MIEYYEIAKNFLGKNNWINTIVLIIMAFSFNSKLNKISTTLEIDKIKIEAIEQDLLAYSRSKDICNKKVTQLEFNLKSHIGDAYIREEENE